MPNFKGFFTPSFINSLDNNTREAINELILQSKSISDDMVEITETAKSLKQDYDNRMSDIQRILDGLHTGQAYGEVPLNDGNLNERLNAEELNSHKLNTTGAADGHIVIFDETNSELISLGKTESELEVADASTVGGISPSAFLQPRGIFRVRLTANQTLTTAGTTYLLNMGTEESDIDGWYNAGTYRYQPLVAGYYEFSAQAWTNAAITDGAYCGIVIRKNGASNVVNTRYNQSGVTNRMSLPLSSGVVYLNGSTDYVELTAYSGMNNTVITGADTSATWWSGKLVKAA